MLIAYMHSIHAGSYHLLNGPLIINSGNVASYGMSYKNNHTAMPAKTHGLMDNVNLIYYVQQRVATACICFSILLELHLENVYIQ